MTPTRAEWTALVEHQRPDDSLAEILVTAESDDPDDVIETAVTLVPDESLLLRVGIWRGDHDDRPDRVDLEPFSDWLLERYSTIAGPDADTDTDVDPRPG